jgi:hypothetical protein
MKNIKIILLIILTPYLGIMFYPKLTKKEICSLRLQNDLMLNQKEELFALTYKRTTNRDLLMDCLFSFIFYQSLISLILLFTVNPLLIFKH